MNSGKDTTRERRKTQSLRGAPKMPLSMKMTIDLREEAFPCKKKGSV